MPQHTINEGFNPNTGVQTKTHFEDGDMIVQKTVDMEPYLRTAKAAREANEGRRWGEGRTVGTLPPHVYAQVLTINDPQEKQRFVREFFRQNPDLVHYEPYLKA